MTKKLFAGLALLLVTGCGGGATVLKLERYDSTCSAAADCVAVTLDTCAICQCGTAAINSKSKSAFDADAATAARSCGPRPAVACAPCVPVVLSCNAGRCALGG